MYFKLVTAAMVVALSAVAFGSSPVFTPVARKRSAPVAPKQPTFPGFPGFPPSKPDPTQPPTVPTLPPRPDGGPEVPFPLDAILPFPWASIEGVWRVELNAVHLIFSFKVEKDLKGKQYLRVLQIDHTTNQLLAEGVGIGIENDKLVRAAMTSKVDNSGSYMLFIGSYKNTAHFVVAGQLTSTVTVLTVRSFSDLIGDKDVQVVVTKVSNTPYQLQKSLPRPVIAY